MREAEPRRMSTGERAVPPTDTHLGQFSVALWAVANRARSNRRGVPGANGRPVDAQYTALHGKITINGSRCRDTGR